MSNIKFKSIYILTFILVLTLLLSGCGHKTIVGPASTGDIIQERISYTPNLDIKSSLIAHTGKWSFTVRQTDENVDVQIEELNSTAIKVILVQKGIKEAKDISVAVCNDGKVGVKEVAVKDSILSSKTLVTKDMSKEKDARTTWCSQTKGSSIMLLDKVKTSDILTKEIIFNVDSNATNFTMYAGEGSVVIDGTSTNTASAYTPNKNICRTPNGILHVAYRGEGDDVLYTSSSNNGTTWAASTTLRIGTVATVGVLCKSNNNVTVYYIESGDLRALDYNTSWSAIYQIEDDIATLESPSCDVDSNDVYHCTAHDGNDQVIYVNSSDLDNAVNVYSNTSFTPNMCDLAIVPENNDVLIACSESDTSTYYIFSRAKGWGYSSNRTVIGSSVTGVTLGLYPSIVSRNGLIYFYASTGPSTEPDAYIGTYCTSPYNQLTFTCTYTNTVVYSQHPEIAVSGDGFLFLLHDSSSGTTGSLYYSIKGSNDIWSSKTLLDNAANYGSIADSAFPISNRMQGTVYYLYTTSGFDLVFNTFNMAQPPLVENVSFLPESISITDTLIGYCKGVNQSTEPMNAAYKWYVNDVIVSSGTYTGMTSNVTKNIANLTAGYASRGKTIIFSCAITDTFYNTTYTNSSPRVGVNSISNITQVSLVQDYLSTTIPFDVNFTVTDSDSDLMDVTVTWFRNRSNVITQDTVYTHTFFNVVTGSTTTTSSGQGRFEGTRLVGDKYLVQVQVYDSVNYTYLNSSWKQVYSVPNYTLNFPTMGESLVNNIDPTLNITILDTDGDSVIVRFISNSSQTDICYPVNYTDGQVATCQWNDLDKGIPYYWFVNLSDGKFDVQSEMLNFTPNFDPIILNFRIDTINENNITLKWNKDVNMTWLSYSTLTLNNVAIDSAGSTISDAETATGTGLDRDTDYRIRWQIGYYNASGYEVISPARYIPFRTLGMRNDLDSYVYKRLITINISEYSADLDNYAINLSLNNANFNYSTYIGFPKLNWTNLKDIRLVDYYDNRSLSYNISYINIPGDGGYLSQILPNQTGYSGSFDDYTFCHDGSWSTRCIPNPNAIDYFNYTIPTGALTSSTLRAYLGYSRNASGDYYYDKRIPVSCFGGTKLQFRIIANYTIKNNSIWCYNQSSPNWILIDDSDGKSSYIFETMVNWVFSSQADILVKPLHFKNKWQNNTEGIDKNYQTKFWLYYDNTAATQASTSINYSGLIQGHYTIGAQTSYTSGYPIITNLNDATGLGATGTNISWTVDQLTDNRIIYGLDPWFIESQYTWRVMNETLTFSNVFADTDTTVTLSAYPAEYITMVTVTCSNASLSSYYIVNTSKSPVEVTFLDRNVSKFNTWSVKYTYNKTWERSTAHPVFKLEDLTTNQKYYYKVQSNSTSSGLISYKTDDFTLGTIPTLPTASFYNYTEDRVGKISTICFNVTSMGGLSTLNASVQYFNQSLLGFSNTSLTTVTSVGTLVCKPINVDYGNNYTYRLKMVGTTGTAYSDAYTNEFMAIQEFFAGSYIKDDSDMRQRRYCRNAPLTAPDAGSPCYEQRGYREGGNEEEDWMWIETNITNEGTLTIHWWNGSTWSTYAMTNHTSNNMKYKLMSNLGQNWYTFYITNVSNAIVLNWTKPDVNHPNEGNRTEIAKYVSFNWTKTPIDYDIYYMEYTAYTGEATSHCVHFIQLALGYTDEKKAILDCMSYSTSYGQSGGLVTSPYMTGTAYDRGQYFKGGVFDGGPIDTGFLQTLPSVRELVDSNFTSVALGNSSSRACFTFTDYVWNIDKVPSNNITSYYYRYWVSDYTYSSWNDEAQPRKFSSTCFRRYNDTTGLWGGGSTITSACIGNSLFLNETQIQHEPNSTFNSMYNQTLVMGVKYGTNIDMSNEQYYDIVPYFAGAYWPNQMINKYQQAFIIYNLPDNDTLRSLDSDADGLNDYDELFVYYTNPKDSDTDKDLFPDGIEIEEEYDPNLYNDYPPVPLAVTLISPEDGHEFPVMNHTLSCSAYPISGNITNITLTVWNTSNSELLYNYTQSYTTSGTVLLTHTWNNSINGNFTWNCLATSTNTGTKYAYVNYTFSFITMAIINTTFNMTSDEGCLNWQTNYSDACNTTDSTPTVEFDTTSNANCSIMNVAQSYNSTYVCPKTTSKHHVCTLNSLFKTYYGYSNLYVACQYDGTEGPLRINMLGGSFSCLKTVGQNCGVVIDNGCALVYQT